MLFTTSVAQTVWAKQQNARDTCAGGAENYSEFMGPGHEQNATGPTSARLAARQRVAAQQVLVRLARRRESLLVRLAPDVDAAAVRRNAREGVRDPLADVVLARHVQRRHVRRLRRHALGRRRLRRVVAPAPAPLQGDPEEERTHLSVQRTVNMHNTREKVFLSRKMCMLGNCEFPAHSRER